MAPYKEVMGFPIKEEDRKTFNSEPEKVEPDRIIFPKTIK
jgi:hypothetical protein